MKRSLNQQSIFETYPKWLQYTLSKPSNYMQKQTGIPAPLLNRMKQGKVTNFSFETISKLNTYYYKYWDKRLSSKGVADFERRKVIPSYSVKELSYLGTITDKVAHWIQKRKFKTTGKKVPLKYIKEGMSRSYRTASDWKFFMDNNLQSKKPKDFNDEKY